MDRKVGALLGTVGLIVTSGAASAAAPTITSIQPAAGPLGTKIVITGTGFGGAKSVTIDGTPASFTVESLTRINATVPATGTGKIVIVNKGTVGTSSSVFTVTPGVALSPSIGHESSDVTVTGAGFAPYSLTDLYFDTTDEALAVSNSLGVVSIKIQVPTAAQPGTHWITLSTRSSGIAAQHSFTVNTNWTMQGEAATGVGFNPYENMLSTSNVGQLAAAWSQPDGGYGNASPIIEVNGNLFTGDVTGNIRSYSATGTLLWTATPSGADFQSVAPAANASHVFFGSGTSVYAYKLGCRTDGGVCAPTWTATIGATVAGSLTVYDNKLYVPGSDGNIYPLNFDTGAVGTPFAAYSASSAATSAVTFDIDGSYYYAEGDVLAYTTTGGFSGVQAYGGAVSGVAVSAGRAYFTTADGMIHRHSGWSAATSGTGCAPAPAVAGHFVYAGGCSSISEFEAGNGTLEWSVTTNGNLIGLSVANGVLYGCVANTIEGELVAYDALSGTLLWSGGHCTSAPIVANGNVYAALAEITAYTLPGLNPNYVAPKPVRSMLRPNLKLSAQRTPN